MNEHIPAEPSTEPVTIESLQGLLREARWYVFHADCPHQTAYDDQQAMLEKIDAAAPAPPPPAPFEVCGKELAPGIRCASDKGHQGECDDIPF